MQKRMQIKTTRINEKAEFPQYQTDGSVGFDFETLEEVTIHPNEIALLPTGLVMEVPKGYMLMVALRSSTPRKWDLIMPQGVGIVDQDYCGPEDEIKIQVQNVGNGPVDIPAGTRLAQGVFVWVGVVDDWYEETEEVLTVRQSRRPSRGGFGSTGE